MPDTPPMNAATFARRAGVSVRTLHHYEAVGLLAPARTEAGHRRYGPAEAARLAHVRALRALGIGLAEVRRLLDAGADPADAVERHLAYVTAQIDHLTRLRDRLGGVARLLRLRRPLSTDTFLDLLHAMGFPHYTPEQLDQLAARREALGDDAVRDVENEWPGLMSAMGEALDAGTDPSDPTVAALARRWHALVEMFTGGDPGIRQSLQTTYEQDGDHMAALNGMDADRLRAVMAYAARAQDAAGL